MSGESSAPPASAARVSGPRRRALWLTVLAAGLAAVAVLRAVRDLRSRGAAEDLLQNHRRDGARSLQAALVRSAPAADLAAALAAEAVLEEATERIPDERRPSTRPPMRNEAAKRRELAQAKAIVLRAIASRPGWAHHSLTLGRILRRESRDAGGSRDAAFLWDRAFRIAATNAPGMDLVWIAWGNAYAESWNDLPPRLRERAPHVWKRALSAPDFVSRAFASITRALGPQRAIALLPDASASLSAALGSLDPQDLGQSAGLLQGLTRARRRERAALLVQIEKRYRRADTHGTRLACARWFLEQAAGNFDDRPARIQAARVLQLCAEEQAGDWLSHPRAEHVRYFLNGRESSVPGAVLDRTLQGLSGVPEAVRARIKLLAGNREAAEDLTATPGAAAGLEWTPYFLELAKLELSQGKPERARQALTRVAPGAEEECEVLLARRSIARALRDSAEEQAVNERLRWVRGEVYPRESWSPTGTVSLCFDPEWVRGRELTVTLEAARPAVVAYGWDGGRAAMFALPVGVGHFRVATSGLSGRRNLSFETVTGGPAAPVRAALSAAPGAEEPPASAEPAVAPPGRERVPGIRPEGQVF